MNKNYTQRIIYFFLLLLPLIIGLLLLSSCSKIKQQNNNSGALPLDQIKIEKVPLIQSIAARGKRDKLPPSIQILSPSGTITGTVDVLVKATDNIGVASVILYVDDTKVSTSIYAPFTNSLNTGLFYNGVHTLKVTAFDNYGNQSSATSQVTISNGYNDISSPIVTLNVNNSFSIGESIPITVSATDNIGVERIELYINNQLVSAGNYTFNPVSTGSYNIEARAYDAAGNIGVQTKQVDVSITYINPADLPVSVRLTMPTALHQGGEGSCVAFTLMYARSYHANVLVSPEFIFNQITIDQYCNGSALLTGLELLMNKGACTWASMPYTSNGCTIQPNQLQLTEGLNYKIRSYSRILKTDHAAIKTMLVNKKPLVIQATIDDNVRNAGAGFIWNSFSTNPGLHTLVICGYDDSRNAYLALNSWGTAYGDNGYLWIDYDFFSTISSDLFIMNL